MNIHKAVATHRFEKGTFPVFLVFYLFLALSLSFLSGCKKAQATATVAEKAVHSARNIFHTEKSGLSISNGFVVSAKIPIRVDVPSGIAVPGAGMLINRINDWPEVNGKNKKAVKEIELSIRASE